MRELRSLFKIISKNPNLDIAQLKFLVSLSELNADVRAKKLDELLQVFFFQFDVFFYENIPHENEKKEIFRNKK